MNGKDLYRILGDIAGLSVFAGLRDHPLIKALEDLLRALVPDRAAEKDLSLELCGLWAAFTRAFLSHCPDVSFYTALTALSLADENPFTLAAADRKERDSPMLLALTKADLSRLGRIARFDVSTFGFHIAALLRDGALEDAAQGCEESARALWRAEGTEKDALGEIFPKDSDWGEALPAFGEYIASHGAAFQTFPV